MPSAVVGILRALLTSNVAEFSRQMGRASGDVRKFARDTNAMGRQVTNIGRSLTTMFTLPVVAGGGAVAKLAIDFETSFAGVRKTVDATEEEFAELAQGFRDLSKEIPINVNELNRIGEAAGQLGIRNENILGFTETMAKLGVTTNLSADQAATSLARLANITQMPQDQFDRLGSTVVSLGNNFATTEAEIVEMGLRLAGAGNQVGLTEAEILGLAAALSSVGINAESGGTAISRVMVDVAKAVASGGAELEAFAEVALPNSTNAAAEFAEMFRKDAAGAIVTFVEGLGAISEEGGNVFQVLEDLGQGNVRVRDALLRAAGAGDLMRDSLVNASDAWRENTALTEEAQKRFETTQSKLTLLWNRIKDVGVTIGNALLPMINQVIGLFDRAVPLLEGIGSGFAALPMPIQATAVGLLAVAAAGPPVLVILGQLLFAASSIATAFTKKGVATRALTGLLTRLTGASTGLLRPLGLIRPLLTLIAGGLGTVVGIAGAVLGVVFSLTGTWDEFLRILKAVGSIIVSGIIGNFNAMKAVALGVLTPIVDLGVAFGEFLGLRELWDDFVARFSSGMGKIAGWVETAADAMFVFSGRAGDVSAQTDELNQKLREQQEAAGQAKRAVTNLDGAWAGAIDTADLLALSADELNKKFAPNFVTATDRIQEAVDKLLNQALEPLTAEQRRWVTQLNDAGISLKEIAETVGVSEEAIRRFMTRTKEAEERLRELVAAEHALLVTQPKVRLSFDQMLLGAGRRIPVIAQDTIEWGDATAGLGEELNHLIVPIVEAEGATIRLQDALEMIGIKLATEAPPTFISSFGNQLKGFLRDDLGNVILGAIQGGGNVGEAVGAAIFGDIFRADGVLGRKIGDGLTSLLGETLGGAIGSIVPGLGTALGALVGSLASKVGGFFKRLFGGRSLTDNLKRDGERMGLSLSEGFMAALEKEGGFGNDAGRAIMNNLAAAIADSGGVVAVGITRTIELTHDLFSTIEQGGITVERAGEQFNQIFVELLPHAVDQATGEIRPDFLELISLAKEFGVESEQMTKFITDSMDRLAETVQQRRELLGRVAREGAESLRGLIESGFASTRTNVRAAGLAAVAMFNEMIASGMSFGRPSPP